ncbi:MAG: phage portal protein [Pseudomonadota bacterium]
MTTKNTALSDLIALHGMGQARWSGRDGTSLAHAGFRQNVIAYRCIQMIADAASSVPLTVYEGENRMMDHPLCRLLKNPSPDQTGQGMLEALYGHLQISGNAYVEVIPGEGGPAALYLLRPDRVQVEVGQDGWPTAYIYSTGKTRRVIRRGENGMIPVLHIKLFNPLNDRYGQSPMQVAGNAIDLHNAAVEWNKSLLDNAARPSGALVYRGVEGATSLTGDQFDRLKTELNETFQGATNSGRPMVLDGGLDWKPMSMSPAEMDFQQLKNGAARDIALAFGVPPMLLGIPGDNTYSNYQQAVLAFWRQTVLPLVGKMTASLSASLDDGTTQIGFDIDAIDALTESRTARMDAILRADFITDTEKRAILGFPPLTEGNM